MDWVAGLIIKLYRKSRRIMSSLKKKEKGECYNYGKKRYYARECRSIKQTEAAKPNKSRESRKKANTVEYGKESWTAYYKNNYLIYFFEKNRADYFLKGKGPKEERV
jgi:hypothetical protein